MRQAELEDAVGRRGENKRVFEQREADLKAQDRAGKARREAEAGRRLESDEVARRELAQMEAVRKNNDDAYRGELLDQINNRHHTRDQMNDMERQQQLADAENAVRQRQGLAADEQQLRQGKYEEAQGNKAQWEDLLNRREANKQRDADEDFRLRQDMEMRNSAEMEKFGKLKKDQEAILRNNLLGQINERNKSAQKDRKHDLEEADHLRQSWDKQNQWMAQEEADARTNKVREADRIKKEREDIAQRRLAEDLDKAGKDKAERSRAEQEYRSQMDYLSK